LKLKEAAAFRQQVCDIFKKEEAVILGFEGDTALVCFGSPIEQAYIKALGKRRKTHKAFIDPSQKAVSVVNGLTKLGQNDWIYGIETGDCTFLRSLEAGYTAHGRPVVRARMFAALAKRYKTRVVIGEPVKKASGINAQKLASLNIHGSESENIYSWYTLV
jgi:class 3 adenylate cyclase